jgi:F-type H+-transporting ATPase subunit b
VLIDWFTVAAQIVNFLILVFLLKHFLYDRILEAMDKREQRIQDRLDEAERKKQEADQEAESLRSEREELEQKRDEMMSEARDRAEEERKRLARRAREEVESMRQSWHESLEREKSAFTRELRRMAGREVYAVCRRALEDLADAEVEKQMVEVFLGHLEDLDQKERTAMTEASRADEKRVTLRSSFEMPSGLKQKVTQEIHQRLAEDIEVTYETDQSEIPGIELRVKGRKLAWGFEDYLDNLEHEAGRALEAEAEKREQVGKGKEKEAEGHEQQQEGEA